MILEQDLLAILQCPRSGARLVLEGDELAAVGDRPPRRYPVRDGIPVLVDEETQRRAIVEAFKTRSRTYYADNYADGGNAERQARRRHVLDAVRSELRAGSRVLEAGAGPAVLGDDLMRGTSAYVALDISLENLLAGRRRLGSLIGVVGDVTALPFTKGSFDVVLAVGCLEYVRELPLAIAELSRVAAPGATIVASFANAASPRRWWEEWVVHPLLGAAGRLRPGGGPRYRRWVHRAPDIAQQFAAAGCDVLDVRFYGAGLVGYPLSRSGRLRRADEVLAGRSDTLARRGAEFLVRARKRA